MGSKTSNLNPYSRTSYTDLSSCLTLKAYSLEPTTCSTSVTQQPPIASMNAL